MVIRKTYKWQDFLLNRSMSIPFCSISHGKNVLIAVLCHLIRGISSDWGAGSMNFLEASHPFVKGD